MKVTAILSLLAASAIAAPAAEIEARQDGAVNMMVTAAPQWTITNMKRVCATGVCTWSFVRILKQPLKRQI
jgi:hypothetical protein